MDADDATGAVIADALAPSAIEVLDPEDGFGVGLGSDILVVDDDAATGIAYRAALEPLGRNVVVASSGMDAVAKLLDHEFALILLDVAMPGMSGLETARLARRRPRNKRLPIIFVTGETSSTELIVDAYSLGGSDFVAKPVLPEILRAKVRVYLELQERTRTLVDYARQLHEAHVREDDSETLRTERAAFAATARRLRKLQQATAELAGVRTPGEVAAIAVRLGAEAVDAKAAALWVGNADGSMMLAGQHGYPPDYLAPWTTVPAGAEIPVMQVFASHEAMWCEGERNYARLAPASYERAREHGYALAFAVLPLCASGKALGVISLVFDSPHPFPADEREFLIALVRASEQALERTRLYVEEIAARQAADDARRRKDEFLAMLGHELRNPLAAMTTAFDLVKMRDGALSRELVIVDRQLSHLARLVGDLVDVSRVTRGAIALDRGPIEVAQAVGDAIALAKPILDKHAHALIVAVPTGLTIEADRERVAQVVAHLLTNAAKYTPGVGRIEVAAEQVGANVRITVRDNGMGIPEPLRSQLFEPFVQGRRSLDRQLGGLGIGLTIVRTIVELHGGTVEATSAGTGQGATLTVMWPASAPRA